jgi:hypothetical protein
LKIIWKMSNNRCKGQKMCLIEIDKEIPIFFTLLKQTKSLLS